MIRLTATSAASATGFKVSDLLRMVIKARARGVHALVLRVPYENRSPFGTSKVLIRIDPNVTTFHRLDR
jgi:hypothetical protein